MTRLGLEPEYDGARFGVWFLDLPGAFLWDRSEGDALARAASALTSFGDWLTAHGEVGVDSDAALEISECVPAIVIDGHEVNATFSTDRIPATRDDIERCLRWLGFAHRDLGPALTIALDVSSEHGAESRRILRHVAGAEVWLGSRLGSRVRYEGPLDATADPDVFTATGEWVASQLRDLVVSQPSIERADRYGETWTLAKVCRRLVYHARDHLAELSALGWS